MIPTQISPLETLLGRGDGSYFEDGYWISRDGEVLEVALDGPANADEPFTIDTPDRADWALGKMATHEGNLLGLQSRRAAVNAQFDRMIKAEQAKLDWLHRRFDSELIDLASRLIAAAKGKLKTWRFTFGSVSFRSSKGTNKITDMPRAVAWMRNKGFAGQIKIVESVNVADALNALSEVEFGEATYGGYPEWIEITSPRESATISTGVGE